MPYGKDRKWNRPADAHLRPSGEAPSREQPRLTSVKTQLGKKAAVILSAAKDRANNARGDLRGSSLRSE
jgi:hypothetical protein